MTERDSILEETLRILVNQGIDPSNVSEKEMAEAVEAAVKGRVADARNEVVASAAARRTGAVVDESLVILQAIDRQWGQALSSLQVLIELATEVGAAFNSEERPGAAKEGAFKIDALTRLHARACLVSRETLWLLQGGFATAAFSRWRTLYEITIVMMFLGSRNDRLSQKYLLHDRIESYKAMLVYKEHYEALGYNAPKEEDVDALQKVRDELVEKYGTPFGKPYGWAAEELNSDRVVFTDIESAVDFDRWRPFYKLSSYGVHAGSRGILYSLEQGQAQQLQVGPSPHGLEDPGQCVALTLTQATTALVMERTTATRLGEVEALKDLSNETVSAFVNSAGKTVEDSSKEKQEKQPFWKLRLAWAITSPILAAVGTFSIFEDILSAGPFVRTIFDNYERVIVSPVEKFLDVSFIAANYLIIGLLITSARTMAIYKNMWPQGTFVDHTGKVFHYKKYAIWAPHRVSGVLVTLLFVPIWPILLYWWFPGKTASPEFHQRVRRDQVDWLVIYLMVLLGILIINESIKVIAS